MVGFKDNALFFKSMSAMVHARTGTRIMMMMMIMMITIMIIK